MEINDYMKIINDLNASGGININDKFFSTLSKKYKSFSEETLRSIIGLWYQRKVAQTCFRIKDIDIQDLYKKLVQSGVENACLHIANHLEYPPSLIAKIVLTNYLSTLKSNKNKTNVKEIKNLRKQQCTHCKLLNYSATNKIVGSEISTTEIPLIKRHDDPRVELALNLFDEDDEIEKYFLDKLTFSQNKNKSNNIFSKKIEPNKSYKYFWQASSFEEMGEKNVKKYTNVEKLFSDTDQLNKINKADRLFTVPNKLKQVSQFANCSKFNVDNFSVISTNISSNTSSSENKTKNMQNYKITNSKNSSTFLQYDSNIGLEVQKNKNSELVSKSLSNDSELRINSTSKCNCICNSNSNDSDTNSENSKEISDNFNVKELLENPSLIEDPELARDVFLCTISDDQYGPTSDIIAYSSGIMYEKLLEEYVKDVGLPYKTENKLRRVGVDKTPDIILLVPIAIENFVITWVESKALFADYKLHQDFEKNQFKNYVNRFGPGLVIYWHGYVAELRKSDLVNKQIIISDRFPSKENFSVVNSDKFKSWMHSTKSFT